METHPLPSPCKVTHWLSKNYTGKKISTLVANGKDVYVSVSHVRRNTFKYNKDPLKLKMAVRDYSKAITNINLNIVLHVAITGIYQKKNLRIPSLLPSPSCSG